MVGSRTVTALVGLAGSLAISVAAWWYLETFLLFLFVPFVPLLLPGFGIGRGSAVRTRPTVRECPRCGFRTRDPAYEYCPRDGSRLQ